MDTITELAEAIAAAAETNNEGLRAIARELGNGRDNTFGSNSAGIGWVLDNGLNNLAVAIAKGLSEIADANREQADAIDRLADAMKRR